mmetsp:Transcript_9891/g.60304  ORF Transcript_9891/g.60304 Transcript_9891/m.60304 type:complete len:322 (-) Transcript_9891:169-1134(-)
MWAPQPSPTRVWTDVGPTTESFVVVRAEARASCDDGAHVRADHVDVLAFRGACFAAEMEEVVVEVHVPGKHVAKAAGAREERCSRAGTDLGAHGRERGSGARRAASVPHVGWWKCGTGGSGWIDSEAEAARGMWLLSKLHHDHDHGHQKETHGKNPGHIGSGTSGRCQRWIGTHTGKCRQRVGGDPTVPVWNGRRRTGTGRNRRTTGESQAVWTGSGRAHRARGRDPEASGKDPDDRSSAVGLSHREDQVGWTIRVERIAREENMGAQSRVSSQDTRRRVGNRIHVDCEPRPCTIDQAQSASTRVAQIFLQVRDLQCENRM